MAPDFENGYGLLANAKAENLYGKLVLQIKKDFALSNIPIDLASDVTAEKLWTFLHEKVYFLIMEKFPDYLNLLYVVDVPEKAFKGIQVTDAVEVAEQVSLLILKREYRKVRLKEKYSS